MNPIKFIHIEPPVRGGPLTLEDYIKYHNPTIEEMCGFSILCSSGMHYHLYKNNVGWVVVDGYYGLGSRDRAVYLIMYLMSVEGK